MGTYCPYLQTKEKERKARSAIRGNHVGLIRDSHWNKWWMGFSSRHLPINQEMPSPFRLGPHRFKYTSNPSFLLDISDDSIRKDIVSGCFYFPCHSHLAQSLLGTPFLSHVSIAYISKLVLIRNNLKSDQPSNNLLNQPPKSHAMQSNQIICIKLAWTLAPFISCDESGLCSSPPPR